MVIKLFKKEPLFFGEKKLPHHIAFSLKESLIFKEGEDYNEKTNKIVTRIDEMLKICVKQNIPIITFYLTKGDIANKQETLDCIEKMLERISLFPIINEQKIKVTVLGKWYSMPSKIIEETKKIMNETKDYDSFFLNFCLNYDGQEEILDAAKLLVRQVLAEKMTLEGIDKQAIKDNLYSSYFVPPGLIILTGKQRTTEGLLQWDSGNSVIYVSDVPFMDFSKSELDKALSFYGR